MWRLGVDIGGTFTDFVLACGDEVLTHKRLTTTPDPSEGVLAGAAQLLRAVSSRIQNAPGRVHHGTTLITNALVERRGAKTALLTTQGFRDVLEIRREGRYDLYDLGLQFSAPLIPEELRLEVKERMLPCGSVQSALDEDHLRRQLERCRQQGVESLAIVFLHSFTNPVHEEQALEMARNILPQVPVSISSKVCPEIREYERTSTTAANAYVRPITEGYLERLVEGIQAEAARHSTRPATVALMQSDGGLLSPQEAAQVPIRLVESGPAGGVMAAARFQQEMQLPALLSFDMGGTTAKMAFLTREGPRYTSDFEVDRRHLYQRGSGLPLLIPAVDLVEIGAGGGSIAAVSPLGTVTVGPRSAGSLPGPSAYGQGGTRATVTDADLALGFLNPRYFLGGRMSLDLEKAQRALDRDIGAPLSCPTLKAAEMVYQTVTANMADATRVHAAEHGVDLTSNTMIAFGGAGPVHAWGLARHLRVPRLILPGRAGVESAMGLLSAAESYEVGRTQPRSLDSLTTKEIGRVLSQIEEEARSRLSGPGQDAQATATVSMRYRGQGAEIAVPVPGERTPAGLGQAFLSRYRALYGHVVEHISIEVVTWRVRVQARPGNDSFRKAGDEGAGAPVPVEHRQVWNPDTGQMANVPVFRWDQLKEGMTFRGPGVVEDSYSTFVMGFGEAAVTAGRTLVVDLDPGKEPHA